MNSVPSDFLVSLAASASGRVTVQRDPTRVVDASRSVRMNSSLGTGLMRQLLPSAAMTLRLRPVRGFVQSADALFREGLLGEELLAQ
jgi:hypothetical protein